MNRKQGAARNTGLKVAKGKYVWFIDPDDYIETHCLRKLYQTAETENLDILLFNSFCVDENGDNIQPYIEHNILFNGIHKISGIEYIYLQGIWNLHVQPWLRIIRRDFLLQNNIFFPEIAYGEDDIHTLKVYLSCKNLSSLKETFYYYRKTTGSTTRSDQLTADKIFNKCFTLSHIMFELSKEVERKDPTISALIKEGGVYRLNSFSKPLLKMPLIEKKEFFKFIMTHKNLIVLLTKDLKLKNKMLLRCKYLLYLLNPYIKLKLKLNHK